MSLHGKRRLGKKIEKDDIVTRFWYILKNLHLVVVMTIAIDKGNMIFINPLM